MKTQLKDIYDVQSWYYIRPGTYKDVIYLQAKDFDEFGDLKWDLVPELDSKEVQERQYLQDWDILFASKWVRNFAAVYRKEYWKCVASSTFFILRITERNTTIELIPEYLAILLTEAAWWKYFKDNTTWWYIQAISKPILMDYKLEIPPIEKQEKIINFYELYKNQLKIYDKIKEKKEILKTQIILNSNRSNNG